MHDDASSASMAISLFEKTRGNAVLTFVTVTKSAGEFALRIASMSTCAAIASRSAWIAPVFALYAGMNALASSQSLIELRQRRSSGPHKLRTTSDNAGSAIDIQNERNAF